MLDKIFGIRQTEPSRPAQAFMLPAIGSSGIVITEDSALSFGAVFSAVKVISETVALLPWRHFREDGTSRVLLAGSALDNVLHKEPNDEMTPFSFREYLVASALLRGNGYAEIEFSRAGEPLALWPIHSTRVTPERDNSGKLVYVVRQEDGGETTIPKRQMFHLRGPTRDGIVGRSVLALARESFGLAIATEQFSSAFFGNGGTPGLVIQQAEGSPDLDKEGAENLINSFQRRHRGSKNAGKPALLERGFTIESVGISQKDAQFIESRKFNVSEIARWFRLPPHKIGDLEKSTFSNIESQERTFVMDAVLPWTTRLEQESNAKMAPDSTVTKMNIRSLSHGDSEARGKFYTQMRDLGALDINEIRAFEDMNPIGDDGDLRLVPMNMVSLETAAQGGSTDAAGAVRGVLIEAHARLAVKEGHAFKRAVDAGKALSVWAPEFYARHASQLGDALMPGAVAFAQLNGLDSELVAGIVETHASTYCTAAQGRIEAGLEPHTEAQTVQQADRLLGRLQGAA